MRQPWNTLWKLLLTAWVLCILASALAILVLDILPKEPGTPFEFPIRVIDAFFPLPFAIPAALIIYRHPRNTIGWLLMAPTIVFVAATWMTRYLSSFSSAPPPTLPNILMILFSSASWLALIFPLFLIPLLFPTGRPPTPRWNWVLYLAVGMVLFFFFWAGFSKIIQVEFASWVLTNPIGFFELESADIIMPVWGTLLVVMALASMASTVVRYRRAAAVERQQMKWLLFACLLFGSIFIPTSIIGGTENIDDHTTADFIDLLFFLTVAAIPAAIAIAVLRYHLYDIDVIIRLTLVYALVTAMLALVYLGGIVLLQAAFRALTGQTQDIAVVITTLAMAVLFSPLRQRIQAIIDRRFFRQKYNAEHAVSEFTIAARSGSDLDSLTAMLVDIAQKTLQPTQVSVYLKPGKEQETTRN